MEKDIKGKCMEFIGILTNNLKRLESTKYNYWISEFPNGACGNASMLLYLYLQKEMGIECTVIKGECPPYTHVWLKYENIDIDITANQAMFPENEDIIVKSESDWHKKKWGNTQEGSDPTEDDRNIYRLLFNRNAK